MYETLSEQELRKILDSYGAKGTDTDTQLASHTAQLGGHDLRLDGHDNLLASHGGRLTTAEASIVTLDGRLDTVETDLTAAEAELVAQASRVSLLESGLRVVTSAAQLAAALLLGGRIGILGMISVTATVNPQVEGTELIALTGTSGITYPYALGSNHSVIKPAANKVSLINLRITTGNPLTEFTTTDIGVEIDDSPTATVNRLRIEGCDIYGVATPIARAQFFTPSPPPPTAAIARGIRIIDNDLHDFTYSGIFIAENTPGIIIRWNKIHGRLNSVAHSPIRNGIWLGQNANHATISYNEITTVGAHGIEYWNSQTDPLTVSGNDMSVITGNQIYDLLKLPGGSFAISAFGSGPLMISHNICRTASIGIEVYNDYVNKGRLNIIHNHIEDMAGQGMSLNGVTNAHIAHNFIKDVPTIHGMQIINGGRDFEIIDNVFVNAGKYPIFINSQVSLVSAVETVNNGWITLVSAMDAARWVINGQIWFFDLGGSTQLNNNFFTISEYDIPNKRFKIGYDLSTVSPFTSGGSVRESYRKFTIDGNKFYFTDPATPSDARALFLPDVQDCFVTNNKSYVLDSLAAGIGTFKILNASARVHSGTTTVTSLPSGAETDIGGSNFRMAYAAPLT